jgi:hypothetical protein
MSDDVRKRFRKRIRCRPRAFSTCVEQFEAWWSTWMRADPPVVSLEVCWAASELVPILHDNFGALSSLPHRTHIPLRLSAARITVDVKCDGC